MKRILVLFIVTVMTVLLVACEGIFNTTPTDILTDGSTEADTRLYDIALEQMTVENGIDMSLVPDVTKKGIGTLKAGGFKLKSVSSPEHAAEVVIRFFDVKRDDYALLVSYYLENGGKTDDVIATSDIADIEYDWGQISVEFIASYKQILSTVYINKIGKDETTSLEG